MKIKILSWNIWVDGNVKKWEEFILKSNADIIGLQEVKDDDKERDIIGFLTKIGYKHMFARTEQVWDGKIHRHGPAIFSKFPIVKSQKIQLKKGKNERAAAYAQIDGSGELLNIFSTHLIHTHQKSSEQQEEQTKKLISRLPKSKVIVMGDFNATPESESIKEMKKILVDTDPSLTPTWSVYPEGCGECNPQEINTKLDYIFVSKDLKSSSFEVGRSDGSDHLPISVTVEI